VKEDILGILAVLTIILSCFFSSKNQKEENTIHICNYNDSPKCYEKCCNYCEIKSECDCCCCKGRFNKFNGFCCLYKHTIGHI